MQRYAWYTRMIQDEIRKRVNDHLSKNGGLPDGDHKALIKIVLDEGGRIVDFQLFGSSGDPRIDKALEETLKIVRINEAPPEGMPRALRLKVSSRG
jgi:TonB family protein